MEQRLVQQTLVKKYLLGDLDEGEQERIELRLLTDKEFIEEVSITQTDLVDEYVSGNLSARERQSFEKHFLSTPKRFQKLRIARALDRHLETHTRSIAATAIRTPRVPILHPSRRVKVLLSLAAGVVLLIAGHVVREAITHKRSNDRVIEAQKQRVILEKELVKLNHQTTNSAPAALAMLPLTLKPILVREVGENRSVAIPQSPSLIELQLELPTDEYQSYQASLQTNEDVELAAVDGLKAKTLDNGKVVILRLPAWLVGPGGYQIKLRGVLMTGQHEDVGLYPFQITSK
jgi:hypothetical protein